MNINTVKKINLKRSTLGGVDITCWPLWFGSPNAVFPHLNSNNLQPLSNGFLSNETNFQMHFIKDFWFEIRGIRGSPTRQGGFQWGPHALILLINLIITKKVKYDYKYKKLKNLKS